MFLAQRTEWWIAAFPVRGYIVPSELFLQSLLYEFNWIKWSFINPKGELQCYRLNYWQSECEWVSRISCMGPYCRTDEVQGFLFSLPIFSFRVSRAVPNLQVQVCFFSHYQYTYLYSLIKAPYLITTHKNEKISTNPDGITIYKKKVTCGRERYERF